MKSKQTPDEYIIAQIMAKIYSDLGCFKGNEIGLVNTLLVSIIKNGLGEC